MAAQVTGRFAASTTRISLSLPLAFIRHRARCHQRRETIWKSSLASPSDNQFGDDRLWILGSGSIGLFLAASIHMAHPQYPLSILLRDHHADNLIRKDHNEAHIKVLLEQPSSDCHKPRSAVPVPANLITSLHEDPAVTIRALVLSTKAFHAVSALQSIHTHLAADARIVVFCNGALAVRDELEKAFPSEIHWNTELSSITHGAYQNIKHRGSDRCYHVVHAGVGKIFLVHPHPGGDHDLLAPGMLNQAGLNCQVLASPQQMESILWYKLAANCVCNPITAIHQCTNGAMKDFVPDLDKVIADVVREVCEVQHAIASATGQSLQLDPLLVTTFVHQVIADNFENRTSMQQDVWHKRQTEIDFLNGYIVRAGDLHGIACPTNLELREQLLQLEANF
ncbi:dehydropantoate 2-reductase [Seminavis robusta]|uniref:2-dehydropantoate 2-reductase n=1 Tax=Seminavis robusta TaxID=568900 RepID=A0A9N8DBH7_9STRA|nr:dehydropantoate 2-reductase [Seminavis robusta]|eukprot:Sro24_g016580.1 dehydropantoate 2-reductase (395) ;mRNA; f:146283-147467